MSPAPALNGEEEVEAVARAIYAAMDSPCSFRGCGFEDHAERYLRLARAALAARRPATEAEEAVERVRALANELEADAQRQVDQYARDSDAPPALVGRSWVNACRQFRAALAPAADRPTLGE
jgi:hypothetical protein